MISLILAPVFLILATMALRSEGVRWSIAISLALLPALIAFFLGIIGCMIAALITGAYWKIKLP